MRGAIAADAEPSAIVVIVFLLPLDNFRGNERPLASAPRGVRPSRDPDVVTLWPRWLLLRLGLGGWKGILRRTMGPHQTVVLESAPRQRGRTRKGRLPFFFHFPPKGRRGSPCRLYSQKLYRGMQPGPASSIERRIAVVSECKNTDRAVQLRARRVAGSSAPGVEVRIRPHSPDAVAHQSDAQLFSRDNPTLTPSSMRSRAGPPRASAPPPPSRAALSSSG